MVCPVYFLHAWEQKLDQIIKRFYLQEETIPSFTFAIKFDLCQVSPLWTWCLYVDMDVWVKCVKDSVTFSFVLTFLPFDFLEFKHKEITVAF